MVSENIALISQDVFGSLKQEIDIKSLKKGLLVNHRLFRGDIINHTLFLVYEFLEEKYNIQTFVKGKKSNEAYYISFSLRK